MGDTPLGRVLTTFFVAMLPVAELRVAIPLGYDMGLSHLGSMLVSICGNMVPVPFIILFIRHIFAWLRKRSARFERIVSGLERRAEGKSDLVHKYGLIGLTILVAIPLPGTGAWTGSLVAAMLGLRLKHAIPAIFVGVVIAGILMTGITYGFTEIFH